MRSLDVRFQQEPDVIHPMHEFVAEREEYGPSRLLQWNPAVGESNTMIFHVEGDPGPYAAALDSIETVEAYGTTPADGDAFYVYVCERLDDTARQLTDSATRKGLVVMPPVVYRTDRAVDVTVVGTADALQGAVEAAPPGIEAEIRSVGRYHAGRMDAASVLSDRQTAAATAAVDLGYYETPREATIADMADRLDCAPGTAAEHLRKAEAALVDRAVEGLRGGRDESKR